MLKQTTPPKTAAGKRASSSRGKPRRNLPAGERRRELLEAAVELFADKGMGITVQALADRVGVTQPLVHRYFATKADLIAAIRERIQTGHWDPAWREVLADRNRRLEDRIEDFYSRYLPHIYRDSWYRGFLFAALADPSFADSYLGHVTHELLVAIIDEVRHRNGYPSVETIAPFEREIELVWGMHSTLVFVGMRRYVYWTQASRDVDTTVRDQMDAYLLVAPQVLEELMPGKKDAEA